MPTTSSKSFKFSIIERFYQPGCRIFAYKKSSPDIMTTASTLGNQQPTKAPQSIMHRNTALDYTRIVACIMVVAMHCPPSPTSNHSPTDSYILSTISYLTTPCIGLFFMISGALLLPAQVNSYKKFFKHRFKRIVIPTLFWSIVYMFYNYFSHEIELESIACNLMSLPFSAREGVLWYVYTLIGIYFLIPIISPWFLKSTNKQIIFYLALWSITLSYPYLLEFLDITEGDTGILYYFSGYFGYFLLGAFFNKRYPNIKMPLLAVAVIILCIAIPIPLKLLSIPVDFYKMFWYLSLPVATMTAGWFILFRSIPSPSVNSSLNNALSYISSLTFGIYLSHILFRKIIFNCGILNSLPLIPAIIISFFILFMGSFILCAGIKNSLLADIL